MFFVALIFNGIAGTLTLNPSFSHSIPVNGFIPPSRCDVSKLKDFLAGQPEQRNANHKVEYSCVNDILLINVLRCSHNKNQIPAHRDL